MSKKHLVVMEVSQKQRYIFGSNRLRENIGASIVIARMTEEVPKEAYRESIQSGNQELNKVLESHSEDADQYLTSHLEFNGGGKSVYSFPSEKEAKLFIHTVSLFVLKSYFGIEVFFAMQEVKTANKLEDIQALYQKLAEKKSRRLQSFRLHGIGLTEKCPSTSLPVHKIDNQTGLPDKVIKAADKYQKALEKQQKTKTGKIDTYGKDGFHLEVYTKLAALEEEEDSEKAKAFSRFITDKDNYVFPRDLDKIGGTKEEKNKIAIIAVDGNGMGRRIRSIQNLIKQEADMDNVEVLKIFSQYISRVYEESIHKTVKRVETEWENLNVYLELTTEGEKKCLPLRPLIAAGDDICFITEARIGLDFTRLLLQNINETSKEMLNQMSKTAPWITKVVHPEEGMYASAGVVICGEKYPFARAYDLAEELLKTGKKKLARKSSVIGGDASMLDFHVAMGEIEDNLTKEREKRNIGTGIHTVKPYILSRDDLPFSFTKLQKAMQILSEQTGEQDDKTGKGQIKELLYFIRQGKQFASNFVLQSNRLKEETFQEIIGEEKDYTILLDAIEMFDFSVQIGGKDA